MTELRNQINNIVQDHQECLVLAKSVGSSEVYEGTTATEEDIKKGKTAYSNGKKLIGTLEGGNTLLDTTLGKGESSSAYMNVSSIYKIIKKLPDDLVLSGTDGTNMFKGCAALEELPENLDTSKLTTMNNMFYECKSLKNIPLLDTSNVTYIGYAFELCSALEEIPLLDTSNVTSMQSTFRGCSSLKHIPLLNTAQNSGSSLTMKGTFSGCISLTDESLNNILAMCIAAVKFTNASYKSLKYIGISSDQATRCQSLSNYQAFLDAGWTTGY